MAQLVSCPNCGRVNRLSDPKAKGNGLFRCGACSTTVQRTASRPETASDDKILDAEFTRYEVSKPLLFASWFAAFALALGFTSIFDPLYGALRFFPFAVAAYATFVAARSKRNAWIWLMGGLTLCYGPIMISLLDRFSWSIIDFAAILLLIAAPFNCLVEEKSQAKRKRIKAHISQMSAAE